MQIFTRKRILIICIVGVVLIGAIVLAVCCNLNSQNTVVQEQIQSAEDTSSDYMKKYEFSSEEVQGLIADGYNIGDINKAQILAVKAGMEKERILEKRGRYPNVMSWKKVKKELNLDLRPAAEKLGLSKKQIRRLKKNGYSNDEITEIALDVMFKEAKVKDYMR